MVINALKKWYYGADKWARKQVPTIDVDSLDPYTYAGQTSLAPWEYSIYDGSKFEGGFGTTQLSDIDYWSLRRRSDQLFRENLYALGLIRRMITNEINTGLTLESCPDEEILGLAPGSLNDWTETVETRFTIYGKNPLVFDFNQKLSFGRAQQAVKLEALITGDVLVVMRYGRASRLPQVQIISGNDVQTPLGSRFSIRKGNTIEHGVEIDAQGREAGYWIRQKDGNFARMPAYGEKSGRRIAWLIYGTDKRLNERRGMPLLAIVLQSLKEIDRYRDSAQRKAVINSILAMFIKKTTDKPGSLPMTGAARTKGQVTGTDPVTGAARVFNVSKFVPGIILDELQEGEEPVVKGGEGTDVNFGPFEEAIIQAVAWANEIPPEILKLAFSNNYSASQAAINEYKLFLNKSRENFGEDFCGPIYQEWLLAEVLQGKIKANGLLAAFRDTSKYDIFGAWLQCEWYGSIKPSTDMLKAFKGSSGLLSEGLSTRAKEARELTGTKYSKNVRKLIRENEELASAMRPLLEIKKEFGQQAAIDKTLSALDKAVVTLLENNNVVN